ncbi:hypothetical protein ABB34_06470 [Stenotrophomonas daejeonensis]|uniref:Uncharacterized protein n=1 Tax=Stenotrophomonas daejeonensis TaxID=659018 RepID=A0A0R0DY50_9GAMM|nr:hypothetical protein ABB34_06470 [Stenotrophomonas daejeonensis]
MSSMRAGCWHAGSIGSRSRRQGRRIQVSTLAGRFARDGIVVINVMVSQSEVALQDAYQLLDRSGLLRRRGFPGPRGRDVTGDDLDAEAVAIGGVALGIGTGRFHAADGLDRSGSPFRLAGTCVFKLALVPGDEGALHFSS